MFSPVPIKYNDIAYKIEYGIIILGNGISLFFWKLMIGHDIPTKSVYWQDKRPHGIPGT